jgi:hypothetical protein
MYLSVTLHRTFVEDDGQPRQGLTTRHKQQASRLPLPLSPSCPAALRACGAPPPTHRALP